jgi:curved DNA-binding protein CbpA
VDSPFDVLGVEPDADDAAIEAAYRERVKKSHPDQGGSAAEFRRVREAYEELKAGDVEAPAVDFDAESGSAASAQPGQNARGTTASEPGSRAPGDAAADSEPKSETDEPETATVEYLDYDAVTDNGWDLGDDDLFEKAADADLDREDYGTITVRTDKPLLETAESEGLSWPYACRGSACANCAVAVMEGEMSMPGDHILTDEMVERGIRLSCAGAPTTDELRVVVNVKHLPGLDELRLPPDPFEGSF